MLVGHEQELPYSMALLHLSSGPHGSPYPPLIARADLSKLSGKLSDRETSSISYYEVVGYGRLRICRREYWLPPDSGDAELRAHALKMSGEYDLESPRLARVINGHAMVRAVMYFYDDKGRIARMEEGGYTQRKPNSEIRICRFYDDKDRLVLFLSPRTTQICSNDEPDVRDAWIRFRYGEVEGEQAKIWDEGHYVDKSGSVSTNSGPVQARTILAERPQPDQTRG
jgi:hypothetical protein